jgi:hypothetical protein
MQAHTRAQCLCSIRAPPLQALHSLCLSRYARISPGACVHEQKSQYPDAHACELVGRHYSALHVRVQTLTCSWSCGAADVACGEPGSPDRVFALLGSMDCADVAGATAAGRVTRVISVGERCLSKTVRWPSNRTRITSPDTLRRVHQPRGQEASKDPSSTSPPSGKTARAVP